MNLIPKHLICSLSLMLLAGFVHAEVQQVTVGDSSRFVEPSESFDIAVSYSTDTGDATLTGLGLRIHFDSSQVSFTGFTNVLTTSKIAQDTSPQDDTADSDGDPATDKYLTIAWVDFGGNWPNSDLPSLLYSAGFTMQAAFRGVTTIRFSASSLSAGYRFSAVPLIVRTED